MRDARRVAEWEYQFMKNTKPLTEAQKRVILKAHGSCVRCGKPSLVRHDLCASCDDVLAGGHRAMR